MANETSKSLVLVSKQNGIVVIPAETPLTRLNYFDGKFLRASDLKAEQDYLRHLVRQSNQAGGSGVAHGFDLGLGGGDTIELGPGLAIDPGGRVLLLPQGTAISVQELIDKSLDLQSVYGKSEVKHNDSFEICEQTTATPPDNITHPNNLYAIVISAAEALCGEEDVYGKLCEEACSTSTDRPLAVEGLIVRAVPLVLQTSLPNPKAVSITTQTHYRSRVAAAYFEDERNRIAHLISAQGLKQQTWCLGADAAGNGGVAIGVFARAGSTTIFLDPWIVRRELIDTPARRYWQWRKMMRPWDVFLAQILQFQCQLHELYQKFPDPEVGIDPCGGARDALKEAAATIAELKQFYEKTSQQFTYLNFDTSKAITLPGGWGALDSLKSKLENVGQGFSLLPPDQWLINGGIVELPSAGYLPVVPDGNVTVNDQVRRMMGKGVDLRFCVVRPDFVAHALEEAQHMERISLTAGLDNATNKPEVDILVPDGEFVATETPDTRLVYAADLELSARSLREGETGNSANEVKLPFKGAARVKALPSGGTAFYLAATSPVKPGPTLNPEIGSSIGLNQGNAEVGMWLTLSVDHNLMLLQAGNTTDISLQAMLAPSVQSASPALQHAELNGVLTVGPPEPNWPVAGTIDATYSMNADSGVPGSGNVAFNFRARQPNSSSIEIQFTTTSGRTEFTIEADWTNPVNVTAKFKIAVDLSERARLEYELKASLSKDANIFSPTHVNHAEAIQALQYIGVARPNEPNFVTEKTEILFPPPPSQSGETVLRAKRDWVLFHRRRNKTCETATVALPNRRYRVFQLAATPPFIEEHGSEDLFPKTPPTKEEILKLSAKDLEPFKPIGEVTFGGGVATFVGDISAVKNGWQKIPEGQILWGAIGSRGDAMTDGESLSRARLQALESALDQVSPNARADVLPIVPPPLDSADVDGVILLINAADQPQPSADLTISKLDTPDPVTPGSNITYVLQVNNAGPTAATDVTVTDAIPPETGFVSASVQSGNGWTATTPTVGSMGSVVFKKASVAAGETATFQITVRVNPTLTSAMTVTNTATVSSPTADPNQPNTSTTTTTVTPPASADLRITKTAISSKDLAGAPTIVYTLTATNFGPSPAQTVTVTDGLPANTTFLSASIQSGTGWTPQTPVVGGTGNVVFSKPSMAVNETATFQIVVKLGPITGTSLFTNTATINSPTADPDAPNNTANASIGVSPPPPPTADLRILKSASSSQGPAGAQIVYTLTATNFGPSPAQTVKVTDAVPANTTFLSASILSGSGWIPQTPAVGGTGNVVFSKPSMAVNETATFQIVVKVGPITGTSLITNTATIGSATTDENAANNTASAPIGVSPPPPQNADLRIQKSSATPASVVLDEGDNISYTLVLTNLGPGAAQNVTVTDATPAKTTFVSASVGSGTGWISTKPPVGGTGNVLFTKPSMAAGETATFRITVKVNLGASGQVTNIATVKSSNDPVGSNDSATAVNTVLQTPQ